MSIFPLTQTLCHFTDLSPASLIVDLSGESLLGGLALLCFEDFGYFPNWTVWRGGQTSPLGLEGSFLGRGGGLNSKTTQ